MKIYHTHSPSSIAIIILMIMCVLTQAHSRPKVLKVKAGDANSFLQVLDEANKLNADTKSQRLFIYIPNGVYDLGETALTPILGHHIALIGESMEGTIIRNAPKVEAEGISTTATLLNRGLETYLQDLTLQNDLDFYHSGPAGRAVCWQDKGIRTMMKHVRMLSYQDTYYSHSEECQHYLEDCEIHGTVDFICGAGDIYFNRCLIVTEKRSIDGSGQNVIAAPRTSTTYWGFVFDHCTIRNDVSEFTFARGWHTNPRCSWINTRLETPEKLLPSRFDPYSIRSVECTFKEYGTTDGNGRNITPTSNIITLIHNNDSNTVETIISSKEARRFSPKAVYPKWRPDKKVQKLFKQVKKLQ